MTVWVWRFRLFLIASFQSPSKHRDFYRAIKVISMKISIVKNSFLPRNRKEEYRRSQRVVRKELSNFCFTIFLPVMQPGAQLRRGPRMIRIKVFSRTLCVFQDFLSDRSLPREKLLILHPPHDFRVKTQPRNIFFLICAPLSQHPYALSLPISLYRP